MPCAHSQPRPSPKGFTAFEALIAITILAFLTAAVSGALSAGRQQSKLARDTLNASMLAKALLDEAMRLPATDPSGSTTLGPDAGETRSTFNSVKDFNGYTDGPGNVPDAQGTTHPIHDLAGTAYPDVYQPFLRTVTVSSVSISPPGWNGTLKGLLVTVTVSRDGQSLISLQRVAYY